MEKILSKKDMVKVAEVDFQVGKNLTSGNVFIGDWESKLEEFAKKI